MTIHAFSNKLPGLAATATLAVISYLITALPFMAHSGISSLVIAIVLGILIGNVWHLPHSFNPGIQFSAKRILRTAIILYGFRVSFQQIASIGISGLVLDVAVVSLTLGLGYFVGRKLLKLDRELAILVSIGSAICGAAAVLAAEDVLKSEPYKAAVAVGTVVLFGTTAMFLYPLLQKSGLFGLTNMQYGVYAGASVHEVAQALVAGSNVGVEAGKIAVIVKMLRVLMLVPVLILLSAFYKKGKSSKAKISIPWFAIFFVVVIGINSLNLFSQPTIESINLLDTFLLTMAMGAIGMETKLSKIKKVGMPPLYLALVLFAWLTGGTYLMVLALG